MSLKVDAILSFIGKHIKKAYIITGKPQREDRYDYPPESLREIVLNMIIHRDYSHSSDSIIKIFNEKIEFFNPGNLLPPLTIEKLKSGDYISVTRNKQIATFFKEAGMIEKYGSGVKRITDNFLANSLPEPKLENFQHGFRVTVYTKSFSYTDNVGNNVGDNVGDNRLIEIITLIKQKNQISAKQLAKQLSVSDRTIERDIEKLKKQEKLKRIGNEKNGYWEVMGK